MQFRSAITDYLTKPVRTKTLMQALSSCKPMKNIDDPHVSLIDPTALQEIYRIGGNLPEFLVEIIDCYLQEAPKLLSAAREALAQHDSRTLKRSVHTLRSSSATVGAMTLAKLCEELEARAISVSQAEIIDHLQSLESEYYQVAIALRQECQRFLNADKPESRG
jgi:HPt (histidine-containing phosphotransfer) domain-containing protein